MNLSWDPTSGVGGSGRLTRSSGRPSGRLSTGGGRHEAALFEPSRISGSMHGSMIPINSLGCIVSVDLGIYVPESIAKGSSGKSFEH